MKLAAYLAAEPRPAGDATLVERETGAPGQASIKVWDLYTDDGRYFFSHTKTGLLAQVKKNNNQGDGQFGREVAAATYAVTGDLGTAALKMAWPYATPVPAWLSAQVKNMRAPAKAGGLQIDNYVWENCQDALVAGSGTPRCGPACCAWCPRCPTSPLPMAPLTASPRSARPRSLVRTGRSRARPASGRPAGFAAATTLGSRP